LALRSALRFEEVAAHGHHDAVAIFRETGDRHWESIALGNLETYRADQAAESKREQQ
jgi:hypothetical protein